MMFPFHLVHGNMADHVHPRMRQRLKRIDRLWKEVEAVPAHPWTQGDLARHLNMSSSQVVRTFATLHGCTPMRWVSRIRIQQAAKLLREEDATLEDVAERVGYASPFSFSRAFKRITGVSPKEYRTCPCASVGG